MSESSNNVIKENGLNRNNDVQAQYIILKRIMVSPSNNLGKRQ